MTTSFNPPLPSRSLIWSFVLVLALALLLMPAGCAPDANLVGEGARPSGGGADVAGVALVDPMPGAVDVPPNLAALLLQFASPPPAAPPTVTGGGARAATGDLAEAPCPDGAPGTCVRLPLAAPLLAATTYVVALADGGAVAQFTTAAAADLAPPIIAGLAVAVVGPCASVSFETDEPVTATVALAAGDVRQQIAAGAAGERRFALAVPLGAFAPGAVVSVVVTAADRAGNAATSPGVDLSVPAGLLPLAITEVHANAAGPEPAQEYVEIRNLGDAPVALSELLFEDAKGSDVLTAAAPLGAGAYALIVPAGFDAAGVGDPPPREGTLLVRVDARLGGDGLANGGEALRLRGAGGIVVSSHEFPVDVSATAWVGRSVHRVPEAACDLPASWTRRPAEATPGWVAP